MAKRAVKIDDVEPVTSDESVRPPYASQDKKEISVTPGSPEWTDYLLSQLTPEEVYVQEQSGKVFPKAAGLRRLVYNMFQVLSSESSVPVIISNGPNAVPTVGITHTVRVQPQAWFPQVASGCAVAHPANLDGFVFSGETAETRARCRAYINLLGLDTCSKEELVAAPPLPKNEKVTPAQASAIRALCRKMDINPLKFASANRDKTTYTDLCDIPAEKYLPMMRVLDDYQKLCIRGAETPQENEVMARIQSFKN